MNSQKTAHLLRIETTCLNHIHEWGKEALGQNRPKTREEKLSSLNGYHCANDDNFLVFPRCTDCNPGLRVVQIPNRKPIIEAKLRVFPNCENCNPDKTVILIERVI